MVDIEKLDNELYGSIYGKPRKGDYEEIWAKIVSNPKILREAVKVKKDKFNEYDIVKGLTIADQMLIYYDSVDKVAYNDLINSIYTNEDIARIVMDGASNGGYSYLLMSLWNHDLKLTKEQKDFAVNEAMNKIGTTRYKNSIDSFSALSRKQAHGIGEFDIRYQILRNPNWTFEEKQQLIMDFWYDNNDYDETLNHWEWEIINDPDNLNEETYMPYINRDHMYELNYEALLNLFKNKITTDKIYEEIKFCKQMHKLRPQQWELDESKQKVLKRLY